MGRPACSVRSSAYVAKKTGAPVMTGYMIQTDYDRYETIIGDELNWVENADYEEELLWNNQNQSNAVQEFIMKKPELWFWIHKRWKNQPESAASPYKSH